MGKFVFFAGLVLFWATGCTPGRDKLKAEYQKYQNQKATAASVSVPDTMAISVNKHGLAFHIVDRLRESLLILNASQMVSAFDQAQTPKQIPLRWLSADFTQWMVQLPAADLAGIQQNETWYFQGNYFTERSENLPQIFVKAESSPSFRVFDLKSKSIGTVDQVVLNDLRKQLVLSSDDRRTFHVEYRVMSSARFTLGIAEANLDLHPSLSYDLIFKNSNEVEISNLHENAITAQPKNIQVVISNSTPVTVRFDKCLIMNGSFLDKDLTEVKAEGERVSLRTVAQNKSPSFEYLASDVNCANQPLFTLHFLADGKLIKAGK